jgi:adenosylmethionine-8-amino-7-oxononanoate aminotransferase
MQVQATLAERDLRYLWHPCSQMKHHEKIALLPIQAAKGCWLTLSDGRRVFDATSSWWCKSLGHGHPRLKGALLAQLEKFEHVLLAGTTNVSIVDLSEALCGLMPGLAKVFYASDGSSAVEIALKMSLHVRHLQGQTQRTQFLCLENAYHGETLGAMSVSDVGLYRQPYEHMLFETSVLRDLPYVNSKEDALWQDASQAFAKQMPMLEKLAKSLTAIIIEPMLQGAGGMKIISADFLKRLAQWAKENDIHFIADEIMTGFGRTGKMLASEHANITPDFICLSKGMTSGFLPMSAVLTTNVIYDYFYSDKIEAGFLHSHTYSGNALAAAVALETLAVIREEALVDRANALGVTMSAHLNEIRSQFDCLGEVRQLGAMAAVDVRVDNVAAFRQAVFQCGPEHGVHLRPLGSTLYWLPPLITSEAELAQLAKATQATLAAALREQHAN